MVLTTAACGCHHASPLRGSAGVSSSTAPARVTTWATRHSTLKQNWNEWGSENLQDGDLIFILGTSRLFMGLFDFAKFSIEIADSPFSHVGLIAIEDGRPWVYDTVTGGPRRKELGWYLSRSSIQRVAFRRPVLEHKPKLPDVIAFCRDVYADRVPYDNGLVHGNDKYYCSELIDEAFRQQGIVLAEAIPITELPNFAAFPAAVATIAEAATPISRHQSVLFPGNESYGLWSSSELELLLAPQSPQTIPQDLASRDVAVIDTTQR